MSDRFGMLGNTKKPFNIDRNIVINKKNRLVEEYQEKNPAPLYCENCAQISDADYLRVGKNLAKVYCETDFELRKRYYLNLFDWVHTELEKWGQEYENTHPNTDQT